MTTCKDHIGECVECEKATRDDERKKVLREVYEKLEPLWLAITQSNFAVSDGESEKE